VRTSTPPPPPPSQSATPDSANDVVVEVFHDYKCGQSLTKYRASDIVDRCVQFPDVVQSYRMLSGSSLCGSGDPATCSFKISRSYCGQAWTYAGGGCAADGVCGSTGGASVVISATGSCGIRKRSDAPFDDSFLASNFTDISPIVQETRRSDQEGQRRPPCSDAVCTDSSCTTETRRRSVDIDSIAAIENSTFGTFGQPLLQKRIFEDPCEPRSYVGDRIVAGSTYNIMTANPPRGANCKLCRFHVIDDFFSTLTTCSL
jgi:hypothetical protein